MIWSNAHAATRLNPVRLPGGTPHQFDPEFKLTGTLPLDITRAYNPTFDDASPLGPGYCTDLDITIVDGETEGTYDLITLDGMAIAFDRPPPQLFSTTVNEAHRHLSLEPLSRGGLKLNDRKLSYTFKRYRGRIWRITQITDLNGNTATLDRDGAGALTRLHHPDGLALQFHNRDDGRRLGYDIVGLDGSVIDGIRYDYDAQGRLNQITNPFGEDWSYGYDAAGNRTLADNGAGTRTQHLYDAENRVVMVDTGGGYKHGRIVYEPSGRQITVYHGTAEEEFEKLWFDEQGRHFMTSDAAGNFSYRAFNAAHDLISETDPNGSAVSYETDPQGNPQSVTDPVGRETFMVWDDQGNLISLVDHAGNAWDYEYDDKGNLEQSRNPLGHVTNFRVTGAGLPMQMMRHDGLIEFRDYDDHNRLVRLIDFNSGETQFTYDAFHRVTGITDPAGNVTRLDYTRQKGCDFNTPVAVIRPDDVSTRRNFTPTGRVETVTDGAGRTTRYAYGPYNVLETITDPRGNDLRFQYDSQERLTQVTNQMGLHWTFQRDKTGRITKETDFDGRTLTYDYEPGGRVIRRGNPDGSHLEYDYDASGRLLEIRAFADAKADPVVTTYGYDENGALITAENPDAKIGLTRDALGRITSETVNGQKIISELDCCGQRSARDFDGQRVEFTYDGMGGLTAWALNGQAPLELTRNAMGQEIERTNGRGFRLQQSWDAIGQLTGQEAGQVVGRSYQWSKAFEPEAIADLHNGTRRYTYDANGQIARTAYDDGTIEAFAYTPDLNLSGSGDADTFVNWETTAAGVVKLAHGPAGEAILLEHDANGRVIKRTITRNGFRPQKWVFVWNAMDQMVSAGCPNGDVWTYRYDPFGRRISKSCAHTRVQFIWDGDVIAREVTMGSGQRDVVDWFFEPGGFRPMARLSHGHLSYVVNDHLGTPKEVVSSDGILEWTADLTTWGSLRQKSAPKPDSGDIWSSAKALAEAPTPEQTLCPIRFQGQWEDAETGMYYNEQRYYCPIARQYTSADPVGAAGGPILHGYVPWPNQWIDPHGLTGVYIFETMNGTCYVGKGAPQRQASSELQRTAEDQSRQRGEPRAGCCRYSSHFDLTQAAQRSGVGISDFSLMVERLIMDDPTVNATTSGDWANVQNSGTAALGRNTTAVGAAQTQADRVLADFRRNNPGTRC